MPKFHISYAGRGGSTIHNQEVRKPYKLYIAPAAKIGEAPKNSKLSAEKLTRVACPNWPFGIFALNTKCVSCCRQATKMIRSPYES